jgi:anti-anti-sigma factor
VQPHPFTVPVVIAVSGELDIANAPAIERALRDAEAAGAREIVLDLSGLHFMGSVGLRIILEADDRARRLGHRLTLRTSPAVQRIAELSGLGSVLALAA